MHPGFLLIPIIFPILAGLLSYLIRFPKEWMRRMYFIAVIFLNAGFMCALLFFAPADSLVLLEFTDTLQFSLRLDGLGKIFAGLVSALWPVTLIYAFDYMKKEKNLRRVCGEFVFYADYVGHDRHQSLIERKPEQKPRRERRGAQYQRFQKEHRQYITARHAERQIRAELALSQLEHERSRISEHERDY